MTMSMPVTSNWEEEEEAQGRQKGYFNCTKCSCWSSAHTTEPHPAACSVVWLISLPGSGDLEVLGATLNTNLIITNGTSTTGLPGLLASQVTSSEGEAGINSPHSTRAIQLLLFLEMPPIFH